MSLVAYPEINGFQYQHSSIRLYAGSAVIEGVKSLNYDQTLTPGKGWGTSPKPILRTVGKYDCKGTVELYLPDYDALVNALGPNFGTAIFQIVATYSEPSLGLFRQDTLVGCRIMHATRRSAEGETPLTVEVELNLMEIIENGVSMVGTTPG